MVKSIDEKEFYHGTHVDCIPSIAKEGLKYGDGILNSGIYITEDWRNALWFGNCLYQVKLKEGTRLLDLSIPHDSKTVEYLAREFGKNIIKAENPFKTLPKNKHLTNNEIINLMRYFFSKSRNKPMKWDKQLKTSWVRMDDAIRRTYRSALIRHGYHGYGHPTNDLGYVIFSPDRIASSELIVSVPDKLLLSNIDNSFGNFSTLEDLVKKLKH
jgi:hypothetical protein